MSVRHSVDCILYDVWCFETVLIVAVGTRIVVNDEIERCGRKRPVTRVEIRTPVLPGGTEEKYGVLQSGFAGSWSRFEPGSSRTRVSIARPLRSVMMCARTQTRGGSVTAPVSKSFPDLHG